MCSGEVETKQGRMKLAEYSGVRQVSAELIWD